MARNEMKTWRCQNRHVLGQVVRNGNGIRQLLLYRQAVDDTQGQTVMQEVDVMAVVQGLVLDVRCSICQRIRTWTPGEESMRQLLSHYRYPDGSALPEADWPGVSHE